MDTIDLQMLVVIVPIIAGIVEIGKRAGLPTRYAGPVAIVLGVAGTVAIGIDPGWGWRILTGVAVGAAASGVYDYTKAVVQRIP